MAEPTNGAENYTIHASNAVKEEFRVLRRQALRQGRNKAVTKAFRQIIKQLERDPRRAGEPTYRLPAMRAQIRTIVVQPLVVDYAVLDDRPIVFIKVVSLLAPRGS